MNKKFKFFTLPLLITSLVLASFPPIVQGLSVAVEQNKLQELRESLEKLPNFLQYTEYKMLNYKLSPPTTQDRYDYSEYRLRPSGPSPLSKEFRSEVNPGRESPLREGINLLTGMRAIEESLQLGSIGVSREFPSEPAKTIDISDLEPLSIKSHPWNKMIKGDQPPIPDIFSAVPADYFMVYFNDMGRFTEFENAIQSLGRPFEPIYGMKEVGAIKDKIFNRLQIKDIKELRNFIDEAVLVSYDLEFSPHTDYALILELKGAIFDKFVTNFVSAPSDRHGKVGDYYIIATNPSTYQEISTIKKEDSLKNSPDVKYVLSVLESDYDGFAYLSEAFIKKLTSPAYRINSRRRNTILQALETLQYTVFAYRDITGKWPDSIQQIIKQGYIAPNSIADLEDYSIDNQGIVHHKDWNTIYDVTPIGRVPIAKVFPAEKDFYDNFREGYQEFWREFIDPVGVSILVGDQIRLRTIILPLIEETQYDWLKDIAGLEPVEFDFITKPDRIPSLQFILKFNLDNVLYAIYKASPGDFDEEYQKCRKSYYNIPWSERRETNLSDFCQLKEKPKPEAIKLVKEKLAKTLDWEEPQDILGFLGNEITLAGGEFLNLSRLTDFANLDAYFAIELKDTEVAKKFLEHVFDKYKQEFSGPSYRRPDYFGPQAFEPIKNRYNGVEFYIIPTGFTNIYYTFLNNRFYMTVSQRAMNNLIDESKVKGQKWDPHMLRLFQYLGPAHNAMLIAKGEKLRDWFKFLVKEDLASYQGRQKFRQKVMYYTEALTLAKVLPGYEGSIKNAEKYYQHPPTNWFNAEFSTRDGSCYMNIDGSEYDVYDIQEAYSSYYYYDHPEQEEEKMKLEDIVEKFDVETFFDQWQAAKSFGVGLKLKPEGLDTRVVFNNPGREELDTRIAPEKELKEIRANLIFYIGGAILVIVVIGGIIFFIIRRRKKKREEPSYLRESGDNFSAFDDNQRPKE